VLILLLPLIDQLFLRVGDENTTEVETISLVQVALDLAGSNGLPHLTVHSLDAGDAEQLPDTQLSCVFPSKQLVH